MILNYFAEECQEPKDVIDNEKQRCKETREDNV